MPKTARAPRTRPTRGRAALPPATNPFRFERRCEDREPAKGALAASYCGEGRVGITRLEVMDRSASGMGVRSRVRIEPGMIVTICPEGSTIPWLAGRAVRCEAEGDDYRVGIAFSNRRAA